MSVHSPNLKEQFRLSLLLAALENVLKLDDDAELRTAARRRYLQLTERKDAA